MAHLIRTKNEAWNDGYNSYLRGCGINHNPFFEHEEFYSYWRQGWNTAREHDDE